ncbi:hypothetical protein B0H16DRAFT_1861665 [Mycena metata]|uniref:Uncharacterized protein n=1 Tax=Mycena metata TaxID=1033252 RepID=A0AAD7N137_9AGAR|nr:hypothetical protein B0H16DRAFT_1861665 [Mycena metata]
MSSFAKNTAESRSRNSDSANNFSVILAFCALPPKMLDDAKLAKHFKPLFTALQARITALPESLPVAEEDNRIHRYLTNFTIDPDEAVVHIANKQWERVFFCSDEEKKALIARGEYGIELVCPFLEFFAEHHAIAGTDGVGMLARRIHNLNTLMDSITYRAGPDITILCSEAQGKCFYCTRQTGASAPESEDDVNDKSYQPPRNPALLSEEESDLDAPAFITCNLRAAIPAGLAKLKIHTENALISDYPLIGAVLHPAIRLVYFESGQWDDGLADRAKIILEHLYEVYKEDTEDKDPSASNKTAKPAPKSPSKGIFRRAVAGGISGSTLRKIQNELEVYFSGIHPMADDDDDVLAWWKILSLPMANQPPQLCAVVQTSYESMINALVSQIFCEVWSQLVPASCQLECRLEKFSNTCLFGVVYRFFVRESALLSRFPGRRRERLQLLEAQLRPNLDTAAARRNLNRNEKGSPTLCTRIRTSRVGGWKDQIKILGPCVIFGAASHHVHVGRASTPLPFFRHPLPPFGRGPHRCSYPSGLLLSHPWPSSSGPPGPRPPPPGFCCPLTSQDDGTSHPHPSVSRGLKRLVPTSTTLSRTVGIDSNPFGPVHRQANSQAYYVPLQYHTSSSSGCFLKHIFPASEDFPDLEVPHWSSTPLDSSFYPPPNVDSKRASRISIAAVELKSGRDGTYEAMRYQLSPTSKTKAAAAALAFAVG